MGLDCKATMKFIQTSTFALVLLVPQFAYPQMFGRGSYEDCITDSMKGVTSDVAATAIIGACRAKFPEASPPPGPSGYFVDDRGIGICSVLWNGDEFVANEGDQPRKSFAPFDITTPSTIVVRMRLPEAIKSDFYKGGDTEGNARIMEHVNRNAASIMRACEDKQIFPDAAQ